MTVRYYIDINVDKLRTGKKPGLLPGYQAKIIYDELQAAVADVVFERRLKTDGLKMVKLEEVTP